MSSLGRPRAKGPSTSGLTTEQDILAAAAHLFCQAGYGSTSTHKIAARAGISQASMYHYFPGKQAILLRLLLETVQPSVEYATALAERDDPADVRLRALCLYDTRLLLSGHDNLGSLYLTPGLDHDDFSEFQLERERLYEVYRELVAGVLETDSKTARPAAMLVIGLIESVILRRRTEGEMNADEVAPAIADAALRILRVPERRLLSVARVTLEAGLV
ncbi:TetR/AcrR family transcriptional regulator [Kineosporia sp. NBRC 101731]|uniref:TetR/AcrR family transcriptional regulator n=1 Tax=Kineosporia sp. NBRC 101731 TaxID=3032199 RepID=UPI0024A4D6E3|nr:TetR/AcrR family transcriptional regulator [Kineosporia sp. NBRC 101731]GLY27899.1 TetR family transcriptional regulator [Kineosporia sp. NBRC 101731]